MIGIVKEQLQRSELEKRKMEIAYAKGDTSLGL